MLDYDSENMRRHKILLTKKILNCQLNVIWMMH